MININDIYKIATSELAVELCLSKGGWEGWLQCELWRTLSLEHRLEVERELYYPNSKKKCDLVINNNGKQLWLELKAFGLFREKGVNNYLDDIAKDVFKLQELRPKNSDGLLIIIVPNAIRDSFMLAIQQRGWNGFQINNNFVNATILHMTL